MIKDKGLTHSKTSGQEIKDVKQTAKAVVKSSKAVKIASSTDKKTETRSSLSLPVFGLDGVKKGTAALPAEIFGAKVNDALMAQAVRIYLMNQRQGNASTKTRSEVRASTRKIYRQKGTGRARHGAITAPIFVGGGIAFGPRPRIFSTKLSKQMRRKALISALSSKMSEQKVFVVDAAAATGKTKEIFNMFKALKLLARKTANSKILYVTGDRNLSLRAVRNMDSLIQEPVENLNTYEVLNSNCVVMSRDAIGKIESFFKGVKE